MSADAPAGTVRRRFLNPHPFPLWWETDQGRVDHAPGAVVDISLPPDHPCPQLAEEVFPTKPARADLPKEG